MTLYVVGEAVGSGGTRAHLARLVDVSESELMTTVVWVNLWEHPVTNASGLVSMIERATEPSDAILLLGRRVARAFDLGHVPPLGEVRRNAGHGPVILMVPHPSGRNRWYNDPDHADDASIALRAVWRTRR